MATRAPIRILVIEDDRDIAEVLCLILRGRGHQVESSSTGRDCVERARSFSPEVVICDIGLRDGPDGFAVAASLRADPDFRGARLIAFTAYVGLDQQVRAAGFEHYLVKPTDMGRLLTVVEDGPR
jgi:CheY-like chemotaxis protein